MAKQSISGRVAQLTRADLPSLLERCEDPESLVDQFVADYTMTIAEAESTVAQTSASVRLLEQDLAEDAEAAQLWAARAADTSAAAEERRAAGDAVAGDRLEGLADRARGEQRWAEQQVADTQPTIDALAALVERLEAGLVTLRSDLERLTADRDDLVATALRDRPQAPTARMIDLRDPEEPLRHFDALVAGEAS
jgi:phage shock protein A